MQKKITPFLWFDNQAEEAMNFYTSIFRNSRKGEVSRSGEAASGPAGRVLTATFELGGLEFTALNGGPMFNFTEAISFQVRCETQDEVDYYWERLSEGGSTQQCGWLKDRFGLSWQVTPTALPRLLSDPDRAKSSRVMQAMLNMVKFDIAALEAAALG